MQPPLLSILAQSYAQRMKGPQAWQPPNIQREWRTHDDIKNIERCERCGEQLRSGVVHIRHCELMQLGARTQHATQPDWKKTIDIKVQLLELPQLC